MNLNHQEWYEAISHIPSSLLFIPLLNKLLLSAYHVSEAILGTGDKVVNKTEKALPP